MRSLEDLRELALKPRTTLVFFGDPDSDTANIGTWYSWEQKGHRLTFFPNNLEHGSEEREWLLKLIREFHGQGKLLWKASRYDQLRDYGEYFNSSVDSELIEFFRPRLPKDDLAALKMSMFLRSQSVKGHSVYRLKEDIRTRFGSRGTNIANLCSAYYFELFKEQLESPDGQFGNGSEEFGDYYEMVVGKRALALFVHSGMSASDIQAQVSEQAEKARRYGLPSFHLHGKGVRNIEAIEQFVRDVAVDSGFKVEKEVENFKLQTVDYRVTIVA